MTDVGASERVVQNRIVRLFRNTLNYNYLGNWIDRENNSNIEEKILRTFLKEKQEYEDGLIAKAIRQLINPTTSCPMESQSIFVEGACIIWWRWSRSISYRHYPDPDYHHTMPLFLEYPCPG